jgi:hypothetical protein
VQVTLGASPASWGLRPLLTAAHSLATWDLSDQRGA